MRKKQKINLKVGDTVRIISGFSKNQIGEVLQIDRKSGKLVVKGMNLKFKHCKPKNENEIGEIKQLEAPIHSSNVKRNLNELS